MRGWETPAFPEHHALSNFMSSCVCYSHYSLKGNKIGHTGAQALAEGLQQCINLQTLQ